MDGGKNTQTIPPTYQRCATPLYIRGTASGKVSPCRGDNAEASNLCIPCSCFVKWNTGVGAAVATKGYLHISFSNQPFYNKKISCGRRHRLVSNVIIISSWNRKISWTHMVCQRSIKQKTPLTKNILSRTNTVYCFPIPKSAVPPCIHG